ncbi:TolB family protein [Streptomyces aureocirculatus]|uniref:TolB family protein n=1 Tax=Streptomyces aureocirculatus TaxID=67275 RepID=UPI00068F9CD1|nr:PD40 domain-containing protein [Streptomyces aureocirculatus]
MRLTTRAALAAALAAAVTGAVLPAAAAADTRAPAPRTERVSVAADGTQADGPSDAADISADGRYAVFQSEATNLVPGDTNQRPDIYLHDLRTKKVERVSLRDSGAQYTSGAGDPSISADGRYVTYSAQVEEAGGLYSGTFLKDRRTGRTEIVSLSDDDKPVFGDYATGARISANGRYVAFVSALKDHGDGGGDGMWTGVYLRDREEGSTRRVSEIVTGHPAWIVAGLTLSADGRHVGYGIGQVRPGLGGRTYVHDARTGTSKRIDLSPTGKDLRIGVPSLSEDGGYAAFESAEPLVGGDTNGKSDIFRLDTRTGKIKKVTRRADGGQTDDHSYQARITPDGRQVAFTSSASGLTAGDPAKGPLYVRDLKSGTTRRVNVPQGGGQSEDQGFTAYASSGDARTFVFTSDATNMVPGDTNAARDVFVRRHVR